MSVDQRQACAKPSYSSYAKGCRCDGCKASARAYRAKKRQRFEAGDLDVTHGEPYAYTLGCRCDPCRKAWNQAARVRARARTRALEELRRAHPDEFRALYRRELRVGGA